MTTFTTTTTNSSFYSDQVDLRDDGQHHGEDEFIALMAIQGMTMGVAQYAKELVEHTNAITKLVADHPEVKDPRVGWDLRPALGRDPGGLVIKVFGTKDWSAEQIAEYEVATKNEHDEITTLRSLIAKYPGKAVEALGYMLEVKKGS